jgi:transcriptional regulator with XRE-family HTH domain
MINDFYKDCIQRELDRRIQKNHSYSLRAFARALKLEPGALSQFLSGKRIPSFKASQKIL